jgi:hypothetical protein
MDKVGRKDSFSTVRTSKEKVRSASAERRVVLKTRNQDIGCIKYVSEEEIEEIKKYTGNRFL